MSRSDADNPRNSQTIRDELMDECGVIEWGELARHFARGVVINVSQRIDLIDVGVIIALDDVVKVEELLQKGLIARASDDDAREWSVGNTKFTCIVAAPWVLVQVQAADTLH